MKRIANFALPILILSLIFLMVTGNFFSASPFVIAAQALAVALMIWARRRFKSGQFSVLAEPKEGPLMSNGPYRLIRHPMYAAGLLLIWSSVLGHLSIITAVVAVIVTCVIFLRIGVEEQYLRERFADYAEYARKTKRVIPYVV